jgi:hypothetical protein
MRTKHSNSTQQGATVLESSLVCIPLILFAALLLELTQSQHVRHIAQLALYEAARTGSVSGAHPHDIDLAFSAAILPLFVPAGIHGNSAKRRDARAQHITNETGLSLWQIETLNPDRFVFEDFSDAELSRKLGRLALRNDYLTEQHQAHIRHGWQEGHGPHSGLTVFEAHTLRLKLSLLYKPLTPGIAFILKKLGARRSDRTGVAWQKGYLVTELVAEVMMQSHAQQWNETARSSRRVKKIDLTPFASIQSKQHMPNKSAPLAPGVPIPLLPKRSGSGVTPDIAQQRTEVRDVATINEVTTVMNGETVTDDATVSEDATVSDDSTVNNAEKEEHKLCDGLLCCQ